LKHVKIYILGEEGLGWSIDKDKENLVKALNDLGYKVTKNFLNDDNILVEWSNIITNLFFIEFVLIFLYISIETHH